MMERLTRRIGTKHEADCAYCTQRRTPDSKGCFIDCELWGKQTEKLTAYEDAEEAGLLLRLPCRIGDIVYIVMRLHYQANGLDMSLYKEVEEVEVCNITIGKPYWQINHDEHEFLPYDFGKSIFLTKEEAEAALKAMQEDPR